MNLVAGVADFYCLARQTLQTWYFPAQLLKDGHGLQDVEGLMLINLSTQELPTAASPQKRTQRIQTTTRNKGKRDQKKQKTKQKTMLARL